MASLTPGALEETSMKTSIAGFLERARHDFLASDDLYLLTADANERSMTHKFAEHLRDQFPGYHVDCEYNRDGFDPKRLMGLKPPQKPDIDDTDAVTVYPDIIVHIRGTDRNLLVIEAKKDYGDESFDRQKLSAFVDDPHYGYHHAYLLRFITGIHPDIIFEQVK